MSKHYNICVSCGQGRGKTPVKPVSPAIGKNNVPVYPVFKILPKIAPKKGK
jgi:hypothetical protein